MLRNYLLTAYRILRQNKVYSIINITGLAVSMTSCLLLFYIIRYELSFDTFHSQGQNIYRIVNEVPYEDGMDYGEGIPAPLPEALRLDFPQINQVATIFSIPDSQIDVFNGQQNGESTFKEDLGVFFAEPQFFNIFDFEWLHGSPASLVEPNTAVLTQETAEKYFGDWRDAIGKSIEYRNSNILKVTGILKNISSASDFPLKVVISFKTRGQENSSWGSITSRRQCFILLDEQTSPAEIQKLMPAFEKKHHPVDQNILDHYTLQPLSNIHSDERYGNFNNRTVSKTNLLGLGLIGILLMITASINFVNLATAQLMKRAKEVGVRKVLGSNQWQLAGQFLGEILLILIASTLLAILVTQAIFPSVRSVLKLPPSFNPSDPLEVTLFLIIMNFAIAALLGFYPVRIMGEFKPVHAMKSKVDSHTVGGLSLRKGLVVVQFVIAQVLVIATIIIVEQLNYFRSAPLGFDKDLIVIVSLPSDSASQTRFASFRNSLRHHAEVRNASFNFTAPLSGTNRRTSFHFDHAAEDAPFEANLKYADVEFFSTYNLTLRAGRIYQSSDTAREFVVNETFLKRLGINNPEQGLGKDVTVNGVTLPIVGVVNDFHLLSLQKKIEPLIMMCDESQYRHAGIKLHGKNTPQAIRDLEKMYRSFFPGNVFEFRFFDDNIAKQYSEEERLSSVTRIFSTIGIFISCLGLYGLISFMAVQRTKEVGVRKVLGASLKDIVLPFYKEFAMLVLIAFILAAPVTAYFMSDWLNTFAYRIDLSPWIFILAIVLTLTISLLTISVQAIKAALANPVESLRSE